MSKRMQLFSTTEDQTLRIKKELAVKIGFNEAVVLMQIEYLISISNNCIDGNWWTYQTLEELKKNSFPWWSTATISRTLKSLKDQGLIFINNFNRRKNDKTQWFALDIEGCKKLGIKFNDKHPIFQIEKWGEVEEEKPQEGPTEIPQSEPESQPEPDAIFQNVDTIFHFDGTIFQNETTLPIDFSKISTENLSLNRDSGQKPPFTKNKASPPISVLAYRSVAQRYPDRATWPAIAEAVGDSEADLQFWKEVVTAWIAKGYKKINIDGMLDWFKKKEIPQGGVYKNGHYKPNQPKTQGADLDPANPEHWKQILKMASKL